MAKREEFTLTLEQCQRLTEVCVAGRANFPKKWGDKDIAIEEQLIGREDLGDLYKLLRSYSGWLQELGDSYKILFGDKADWYPIDSAGRKLEKTEPDDPRISTWKMVDSRKRYSVRMGKEALSGAVWGCILRLHPHCIMPISTKEAVDTWWPIAEILGKTQAIRKYIGIAGAKRTEWEDDPEPASETKAESKA